VTRLHLAEPTLLLLLLLLPLWLLLLLLPAAQRAHSELIRQHQREQIHHLEDLNVAHHPWTTPLAPSPNAPLSVSPPQQQHYAPLKDHTAAVPAAPLLSEPALGVTVGRSGSVGSDPSGTEPLGSCVSELSHR
jgi:hypothetical protein